MKRSRALAAMAAVLTLVVVATAHLSGSAAVPSLPDSEAAFAMCIQTSAAPDVVRCLQQSGFNIPAAHSLAAFSGCAMQAITDRKELDACFATNQITLAGSTPAHVSHAFNFTAVALGVIAGLVVSHAMTKQQVTFTTIPGTTPPQTGEVKPTPGPPTTVTTYSTNHPSVVAPLVTSIAVSQVVSHLFNDTEPSPPTPSPPTEHPATPTPGPTPTPTQISKLSASAPPWKFTAIAPVKPSSPPRKPPSSHGEGPSKSLAQGPSAITTSQTLKSPATSSIRLNLAIAKNTAARATKGNFNFHPYVAREPQSPLLPVYAPIAPLISTNMSMLLKAMVDTETRAEERVSRTTLYVDSFIAMFAGMLLGAALQRTRGERDRRRHRPQRETILELQARRD